MSITNLHELLTFASIPFYTVVMTAVTRTQKEIDEIYDSLTLKQKRFIDGYFLFNGNATRAADYAGYSDNNGGYLGLAGHRAIKNEKIKAVVTAKWDSRRMSPEELVARIGDIGRADISDYVGRVGDIDLVQLITDGHGHLIKGIRHTKHGTEVIFHDTQKAHDQLLKYYGLDRTGQVTVDNRHVSVSYVKENRPDNTSADNTAASRPADNAYKIEHDARRLK